jgi:hypothetical protein
MDTDWIHHEQRLSIIDQKCLPEPLPYITLEFIYINKQSEVVDTATEKLSSSSSSSLSKELLISIIHAHKKRDHKNYVLKDTLLFHIPIQPEILPSFLEETFNTSIFTKTFPIIDDIVLPPSIFIFHPINTLFFVYCEQLKSALKSDHQSQSITKRVRIKLPLQNNNLVASSSRNTRRLLLSSSSSSSSSSYTDEKLS